MNSMLLTFLQYILISNSILGATSQNHDSSSAIWKPVEILKSSILSVAAASKSEIYAGAVDSIDGSLLLYSNNQGQSWISYPTAGNNLHLALSKNKRTMCSIGTKSYCLDLSTPPENDKKLPVHELGMKMSPRDIQPYEEQGMAIIGLVASPETGSVLNGGLIKSNIFSSMEEWHYFDIELPKDEGYFAGSGSFPSNTTWYITSGSWPIQNPLISTMLSGRLNMLPGKDLNSFTSYQYEFLPLNGVRPNSYKGAISKTMDGGRTFKKVLDSNNKYYFNQIDCYNEQHCVVVGEGSFSTVILTTNDGGETWETRLKLNAMYSLHSCKMLNEKEMWVSGGMISDDQVDKFVGIYYHSRNAGETWELMTADGYAYDLSFFDEQIGYAATIHPTTCGISQLISQ